ncbi:MAG: thiamine-phosphate kinase [Candidatus Omnitrophota bacterium]
MRELGFIEYIRRRAGKARKGVKAGIGDDCAVLEYDAARYLLWAADMLVEGTHFRVKDAPYAKIGRKAVAVNISDIAAMGGVPKYITVSIGVPPGAGEGTLRKLYDGIFKICGEYGIQVVGGDTNRSGKLVIDVSIMGFVEKEKLLTRSGARDKDLVLVTGPLRNGKKEHLDFEPRLKEARSLTGKYRVSSMIDVSDGLAPDVWRICRASGVGCRLYEHAIPLSGGLLLQDALYYGESFELLFTMGAGEAGKLMRRQERRKAKPVFFVIGEVTRQKAGLKLIKNSGEESPLEPEGYRHL